MSAPNRSYVLITACRNEAAYIDRLVDMIASQTFPPLRWVIVDDGSTDDTSERITIRSRDLPFLKQAKMPAGRSRDFSSKVYALQHGCELVKNLSFEYIGILDADLRFSDGYYQLLMERFEADPRLGLCGGAVIDQHAHRTDNIRAGSEDFHVAGGVHFFRRQCFEQVGGYTPVEVGGEDVIAEMTAMMLGWRVRSFPEIEVMHLRPEGFGGAGVLQRGMKWGRRFYLLGYHPLYYFAHCVRRMGKKPMIIGSICQLLGFVVAGLKGETRPVSEEFVRFQRKLQISRLRRILIPSFPGKS